MKAFFCHEHPQLSSIFMFTRRFHEGADPQPYEAPLGQLLTNWMSFAVAAMVYSGDLERRSLVSDEATPECLRSVVFLEGYD